MRHMIPMEACEAFLDALVKESSPSAEMIGGGLGALAGLLMYGRQSAKGPDGRTRLEWEADVDRNARDQMAEAGFRSPMSGLSGFLDDRKEQMGVSLRENPLLAGSVAALAGGIGGAVGGRSAANSLRDAKLLTSLLKRSSVEEDSEAHTDKKAEAFIEDALGLRRGLLGEKARLLGVPKRAMAMMELGTQQMTQAGTAPTALTTGMAGLQSQAMSPPNIPPQISPHPVPTHQIDAMKKVASLGEALLKREALKENDLRRRLPLPLQSRTKQDDPSRVERQKQLFALFGG